MRNAIFIICFTLGVSSAMAVLVTDDFDRKNTSWSNEGGLIRADWSYDAASGNWKINSNRLEVQNGTANTVLYNSALQTPCGNGTNFTVSLDVKINAPELAWSGVAFNVQDSTHFYYMRIRGGDTANVQIGRMGTSADLLKNTSAAAGFAYGTDYTMTVSSSDPYTFHCEIKETASGTVLYSDFITDPLSIFAGGYAGVYQGTPGGGTTKSSYDNFSVEVAPESTTELPWAMAGDHVITLATNRMGTTVYMDGATLCEVRGNRYLRFRSHAENDHWIGQDRMPADIGWGYNDIKGYEPVRVAFSLEAGRFELNLVGRKAMADCDQTTTITGVWDDESQNFNYAIYSHIDADLELWHQNSAWGSGQIEPMDFHLERISVPERIYLNDHGEELYDCFVFSDDGIGWVNFPKFQVFYDMYSADWLFKFNRPVGSYFGFVDRNEGGWLTRLLQSSGQSRVEICWFWLDIHQLINDGLPPRHSSDRFTAFQEWEYIKVSPQRAGEIIDGSSPKEPLWKEKPEYKRPVYSTHNHFRKLINGAESQWNWRSTSADCLWDDTVGFDDHQSVSIIKTTPDRTIDAWYAQFQWYSYHMGVPFEWRSVDAGTPHCVSAMVKTEGLSGSVKLSVVNSEGHALLYTGPNGTGTTNMHLLSSSSLTGDNDWTRLSVYFMPEKAWEYISLEVEGLGKVWFDNVVIVPLPESAPFAQIADDFNREDTGMDNSADPSVIGAHWRNGNLRTTSWGIAGEEVEAILPHENEIIYNDALETISGNGTNFMLNVDVKSNVLGSWVGGVAFCVADGDNWYGIRIKSSNDYVQIVKTTAGVTAVASTRHAVAALSENTYYTFTVSSSVAGSFDIELRETGSENLLYSGSWTDSGTALTGGYGGFYQAPSGTGAPMASFDNYSLKLGSESALGYPIWSAGWGNDLGGATNDYDLDGVLNLYEYGLGGDPTNATDQGTAPEFNVSNKGGSNVFNYVYPQLCDPDSGLTYSLALRTNLIAGDWATNTGYTVTGTNVTGETLDFVTNVTDTVAGNKFIRLIIK